jgi:hypothetical protein
VKRFVAMLMLAGGLLVAGGANAGIIFENTLSVNGFNTIFNLSNLANIVPATASGTIDTITVYLAAGTANTLTVKVCTPVNNQPTNCVPFTQQGNIPVQPGGLVNFTSQTGYAVTANTNFMVTFEYTNGSVEMYAASATTGNLFSTFFAGPYNLSGPADYMVASGTVSAPAPTPSAVPTLSEWSQMLLGLMVLSMIGWHFHRERSY